MENLILNEEESRNYLAETLKLKCLWHEFSEDIESEILDFSLEEKIVYVLNEDIKHHYRGRNLKNVPSVALIENPAKLIIMPEKNMSNYALEKFRKYGQFGELTYLGGADYYAILRDGYAWEHIYSSHISAATRNIRLGNMFSYNDKMLSIIQLNC